MLAAGRGNPTLHRLTCIFLLTLLAAPSLFAGETVTIERRNGEHVTGELLSAGDSALTLSTLPGAPEEYLRFHPEKIVKVRVEEIGRLVIEGKSSLYNGLLLGLIAGVGIGTLVSYEPKGKDKYESNFDPFGAGANAILIGAAGGAALGMLAGGTYITEDRTIDLKNPKDIAVLRLCARYEEEPGFLAWMRLAERNNPHRH